MTTNLAARQMVTYEGNKCIVISVKERPAFGDTVVNLRWANSSPHSGGFWAPATAVEAVAG